MTPTEVVDAFIAAIERKDVAAAGELVAEDVRYENMPMDPVLGREAMVQVLDSFLAAVEQVLPEVQFQAVDIQFQRPAA